MSVLSDRLHRRSSDISDATPDLLSRQQAEADPFTEAEQAWVTTIDTTQPDWASKLYFEDC